MSVEWHPENFRQAYGYTYTSTDPDEAGVFTYCSTEPIRAKRSFASDVARGVTCSPLERFVPESLLLAERARADRAVRFFEEATAMIDEKQRRLWDAESALRELHDALPVKMRAVRTKVFDLLDTLRVKAST
jgi:hypothetical protein